MRDITYLIQNTPFKNSTYKFYATTDKDEHPGVFYTPSAITNWWFEPNYTNEGSFNMLLHDICHVIDLYNTNCKNQLLLKDFGWKLQDSGKNLKKVPASCFIRELRVMTLQSFLAERIFGKYYNFNDPYIKRNYRSRVDGEFLPTKKEWENTTFNMLKEHQTMGVVNYIKIWKSACKFVKNNR